MLSLEEARAIIQAKIKPLEVEGIPLPEVQGCVLREDIVATEDLPEFDRSAMDGYAIAANDPAERFRIVMEIPAGTEPSRALGAGECARIFTGAQPPMGATQVIMQENVRIDGEWMIPISREGPAHIRRRGDDARAGAVLLKQRTRLGSCDLALLAQIGQIQPLASPAPMIVHVATGDELVEPEEYLPPRRIRDTNSTMVAALLRERGAMLVRQARCGDDLEELVETIEAFPWHLWDILLISGGASVGNRDFGARALQEMGFTIHFDRVNLRPGKPLIFASRDDEYAFVLPGNPVSHFVTFHLAVRLALECLEKIAPSWPLAEVIMREALPAQADPRETYWPATVRLENGRFVAEPRGWKNSGDLCGLATSNALLQLLPGSGPLQAGDSARCLLLDL